MLRPRKALGQTDPNQMIAQIASSFPACFTSSSILPMLDSAINDGKLASKQATSNAPLITFSATSGDIDSAVARAQALRNRYASEAPNTRYCNNSDATKAQHWATIQTITGIYQAGAGVSAAYNTANDASNQLVQDANPLNHLPNVLPSIPGIPSLSPLQQWMIAGVAAFLIYSLVKGRQTVVVAAPAAGAA